MTIAEAITPTQGQQVTKKKVLRGYCINPAISTNLDTTTLYYLEPQGLSHYWVSRFPNAKRSHMGVYQKKRFKVEREETVIVKPNEPTNNDENKDGQTADFLNEVTSSKKDSLPKGEDSKPIASSEVNDLKWDTIYKANLVRENKGESLSEPYETFYIQRKPKNSPYYNDSSCYFYDDEQLKKGKGCYALTCFADFVEIGPVPVPVNEKKSVTKVNPNETKPAAEEKVDIENPLALETKEPVESVSAAKTEKMNEVSVPPVDADVINKEPSDLNEVQPQAPVIKEVPKVEPTSEETVTADKSQNKKQKKVKKAKDFDELQLNLFEL